MSKLIGVIGAMDIEVDGLISSMSEHTSSVISGITFHSGKIGNNSVVCAKCGIGKVFASICAQTMILEYKPDVIINTGVAGTLTDKLGIMDVAIAENVVQHDMDTSAIGDPIGLISGINVIYIQTDEYAKNTLKNACNLLNCKNEVGTVASGDKFIANSDEKLKISSQFNAIACEMEGAAIGQVCYVNKVPFAILRAISDGEGAEMDYSTFAPLAAKQSVEITKKFIELY